MVLDWNKPEKIMSTEEWKSISADGAPLGVYTPNMSKEDMLKWKAKYISGKDERVEIRKTFHANNNKHGEEDYYNYYCQVLIIVRLNSVYPDVVISTNGKMALSYEEFNKEFVHAIKEAKSVLNKKRSYSSVG
jgi:hypothetical protein